MTAIKHIGEQGTADAFAAAIKGKVMYLAAWKKYAVWDGRRWETENGSTELRGLWQEHLAERTAKAFAETDADKREKIMKLVAADSGVHAENAMLTLLQGRTYGDYRAFDADPLALNVANGILDLRTGELRPHDPEAMCTRLAPVEFTPGAECPHWDAFITWAMQGDAERAAYLQRFFGLCLTGDAEHELAHFFFGTGSNGKSTVVKTIEALLGDYAVRAKASMLMQRKHEAHPTEKATLQGRRLVTFTETNEEQELDEQSLKLVASKDAINARRMREDEWTFVPTHKAILMTNHMPKVRGQDEGVWRRIRLVEWGAFVAVADRDEHFGDRFVPELPGILNWALAGLAETRRGGLRPPSSVLKATSDYRAGEDTIPRWIEDECVRDSSAETSATDLRDSYGLWAFRNGEPAISAKAFAGRLKSAGISGPRLTNGKRLYRGIRLQRPGPSANVAAFAARRAERATLKEEMAAKFKAKKAGGT